MGFVKNHLVIVVGVITLIIVGAGLYLANTLLEENEALVEDIEGKVRTLEDYYRQGDSAPSPTRIAQLESEKIVVESGYNEIIGQFTALPSPRLPEREMFPELYYKETIVFFLDNLYDQADEAGVRIPADLGIPDGLPESKEQIRVDFARLDTLQRILEQIFAARLDSLESIEVGNPQTGDNFTTTTLRITVSGTRSRIAQFIEFLGSSQAIFVLDELSSFSVEGDRATVNLSLRRIIW